MTRLGRPWKSIAPILAILAGWILVAPRSASATGCHVLERPIFGSSLFDAPTGLDEATAASGSAMRVRELPRWLRRPCLPDPAGSTASSTDDLRVSASTDPPEATTPPAPALNRLAPEPARPRISASNRPERPPRRQAA